MKAYPSSSSILLRFDPGESMIAQMLDYCTHEQILYAQVSGIGAADCVKLASFNRKRKCPEEKELRGAYEILTLCGNITAKEGKPFAHLHITISDSEFRVSGGHLCECYVSHTAEIVLSQMGAHRVSRARNSEGFLILE